MRKIENMVPGTTFTAKLTHDARAYRGWQRFIRIDNDWTVVAVDGYDYPFYLVDEETVRDVIIPPPFPDESFL